jgi:hypothetical protein
MKDEILSSIVGGGISQIMESINRKIHPFDFGRMIAEENTRNLGILGIAGNISAFASRQPYNNRVEKKYLNFFQ